MSKRGITITNFLVGGDPEGIIFSYLSNWTGQATKIPRNLFADSKDIEELRRPGVYFLFGNNPDNPDDKLVYVGEANNLYSRIIQHLRDNDKAFAEVIICFSSKDDNLTVSHTKYLEQKLITHISKSNEYRLINKKEGNNVNLSVMVRDEMDTYFDNMKIILPTLGYNVLNNVSKNTDGAKSNKDILKLEVGKIKAESILTSNGIEVLRGSDINKVTTQSLSNSYLNLRKTLEDKRVIIEKDGKYSFKENYEFSSPSTAAAIILGYSVNGRTAWKNKDGQTLKEVEEEKINEAQ